LARLPWFLAFGASLFLAPAAHAAREKVPAATVILLQGDLTYFESGRRHKIDLGQALSQDFRVLTPKDGGLHLVLANGSSLVLGPNTELELKTPDLPPARPRYQARLARGRLALLMDEPDSLVNLELGTEDAVVTVKRAHLELSAVGGETRLTVDQGSAQLMDKDRKKSEEVASLRSAGLGGGRLERAMRLSKREAGEFRQRWQRAEMVHGQRNELIKNLKSLR
jgi:ferric-dicitrate binding protein FerR (iron transport regulator)